jgi:opacity protein-like surface antigen
MRTWVLFLLVLLSAVLVCAQAADSRQSDNWTGSWAGAWNGESGGSGDMRLKLSQVDGQWKGEAGFSMDGADVPTVVKSLKIDGDNIEFEYSFELQGYKLISHLTGKRTARTIEGFYKTSADDGSDVDTGKWKLTLK